MKKFKRSWLLFKNSLSVISKNKELLVFPIVVCFFTVLIVLLFLAPMVLRPMGYSYVSSQHWTAIYHSLFTQTINAHGRSAETGLTSGAMGYLALVYIVSMICATFFNVAFYHEILAALRGESVSIQRGLRFACTRWKAVLMWSLFAGLVGMIIRQIEERLGFVGRIIGRFIGITWSVAAVFVIPIIVQGEQNANPIKMLKSSASILKRTWGEALIGYAGMSLASGLIFILSVVLLAGAMTGSIILNNYWFIAIIGSLWIVAILVLSYLTSVAAQIYKGALFLHAANGVVPEPYSKEMLDSAWKFKKP